GGSVRIAAAIGWLATLAQAAWVVARRTGGTDVGRLVALWSLPHLAYIFVIHDVVTGYPRYMLSAVVVLSLCGGHAVAGGGPQGLPAAATAIAATGVSSGPLARVNHRQEGPALYAAARFLANQPRAAVVADPSTDLLPFYLYDLAPDLPVIVRARS